MSDLSDVDDYIEQARVLLQDEVEPFRYETAELTHALEQAAMEARRIRPDLFLRYLDSEDFVDDVFDDGEFDVDVQYRSAFLYFIVGWAQARDEEDTQDARAAAFLTVFRDQLKGG